MIIPKDKALRIGQQLIVPFNCMDVGINAFKSKISIDISKEVAKNIKITETETENGIKLSADILLVNFKDLKKDI